MNQVISTVTDAMLADVLIARLNELIKNPDICKDISSLLDTRIFCSEATYNHPTIQASMLFAAHDEGEPGIGFLGVLNGLVGAIPDGPRKGWSYIAAECTDAGELIKFVRTT